MKVQTYLDRDVEVTVSVTSEDIRCALRDDTDSAQTVLYCLNDFAAFLKAVPDEIIVDLNVAQKQVVSNFLTEQSSRYHVAPEVYCVWAKNPRDAELIDTGCEELHLINVSNDRNFKFCPYCGNKIKLAESV